MLSGCLYRYPLFFTEGKAIDYLINEQIRDIGVMSSKDALNMAEEQGLDLVKISPNAKPPVCKIIDYSKYRYELARKEKEASKKQKTVDIKEIRFSPNIDTNDLNTKINQARKFLSKGERLRLHLDSEVESLHMLMQQAYSR